MSNGPDNFGATLAALLVILPLAVTAALAVTTLVWRWPRWSRFCLSAVALAVACLPTLALTWCFAGVWLGHLHWPVESLMPSPGGGGWSGVVWSWAPAIFLAAAAPAAALTSFLLPETASPSPETLRARGLKPAGWFDRHELPRLLGLLRPRFKWLAALAALGLVFAEDLLQLPGMGARLADAVRGQDADAAMRHGFALAAIVAIVSLAWGAVLRRSSGRGQGLVNNGSEAVIEGAIAIGLTRHEAWLRHEFPLLVRRWVALLLTAAGWIWLAWVQLGAIAGEWPGATLAAACEGALQDPAAPLRAAAVPALWALSLLLLGRIVAPRARASLTWPTHQTPPRRSSGSAT